jgi:DNA polymerase-3 subunit gamma/tau
MSFQALARTWRPRRFDQLVGQAHVVRALTHALDNDKLHHALLFSGTRGVGKTTLARIIAKCLNCERGVSASPCVGEYACGTCREIDEGRYVDLIEVDAASRTGVDDTRDLMDNVQYAPTRGRTKVYLIDEVHMLTKHSFNALLKTLEEPPPRVQFLLATTEPEKIPVTILSRCLQFPLKRLPIAQIADRLRHIVTAESLSADDEALLELARGADGSMRDGLSLLDQAVAFGGGHLAADDVRDMLGTIGEARVAELVDAIIDARVKDALTALEALYAQGIDMRYLLEAMATAWQQIATIQIVGEAVDDASERWIESAQRSEPRATQLFYDITLAGLRDFVYAPDPLVGTKMTVLRMLAFVPAAADAETPTADQSSPGAEPVSPKTPATPQASAPITQAQATGNGADRAKESALEAMARARAQLTGKPAQPATTPAPVVQQPPDRLNSVAAQPGSAQSTNGRTSRSPNPPSSEDDDETPADPRDDAFFTEPPPPDTSEARTTAQAEPVERIEKHPAEQAADFDFASRSDHPGDWHSLLAKLDIRGFAAQLASNGVCRHLDNERIVLEVARSNALLATDSACEVLQNALAETWGTAKAPHLQVKVVDTVDDTPAQRVEANAEQRQVDAVASIENDPIVRQLQDRLGARLRPETIKPHRAHNAIQPRDEQ